MTRWLDVEVGTDDIQIDTLPSDVALVDLQNDNEVKLIIGDLGLNEEGSKLKVFRGAMQISDMQLPDMPLGVIGFYSTDSIPRPLPFLAVAFASCIYIYRNMKVFYKYYVPSIELSVSEMDIWKQLINSENHQQETVMKLTEKLRSIPDNVISMQSRNLLLMSLGQQLEYLEHINELPLKNTPEITCIGSLKMNSVEKHSVGCLVVATEEGHVIILDPNTFGQLSQAKICGIKKTPYQMLITGLYSVDYRITVVTREKSVCLLKRGWSEGRLLFTTDDHIISAEVMSTDHSVLVICADNTLACYSKKGKRQWCLSMENRPVALTLVPVIHLGVTLVAVALASGHLHFYDGKAKRDTLFVRDVVSVMKFGQLGQEEHVLVIITANGNLMLKILKRTADFNAHALAVDYPLDATMGNKPWLIPKKSKLFLEQSVRERENAVAMHEAFQLELNKLRLAASKSLLEAHLKSDNSTGIGALEPIRLTAEVEGLGPIFRVTLAVENTSSDKAVIGLSILFHIHPMNYKVTNPYIKVPLISPGNKLKFPTKIEEMFSDNVNPDILFRPVTGEGGERCLIKILLIKEGRKTPVLAVAVQMPPTDPMMLPYDKIQAATDITA